MGVSSVRQYDMFFHKASMHASAFAEHSRKVSVRSKYNN